MDAHAAQLRHQINKTRGATDATLTQLEQRVSQMPAVLIEQQVVGPVRGLQETATRATAWLHGHPWLIIAGGALLGISSAANHRPVRPVPAASPAGRPDAPPRAPVGCACETDDLRGPAAAAGRAAAPPTPEEPMRAAPSDSRASAWTLGGLGVTELGRRVIAEIRDDDCLGRAAQLAYYFLFALFPFFLFLTTLLGYLPIPDLLDRLLEMLGQMLPGEALRLVQDNIRQLVTGQRGGLLSFGILAALWTSSSALTAIIDSLNRAYDVEEGRPFWKVRLIAIGITVGLSAFIVVALVLLTFGPQLGRWVADLVGLGQVFEVTWNLMRWPVIVGLLVVAIALLYYFAPDVEQEWTWITPGSACAVLGWLLASLGFAFYVNRFGSYNATYGSIGAVIVLLTWMYVTGLFILIGGEINAEIEHAATGGKEPGEKVPS